MISLSLDKKVAVSAAMLQMAALTVSSDDAAYHELMKCAAHYAERYHSLPIADIPGVKYARALFRTIGIDPTKRRPSSEALLRRAVKHKPLFTVNSLVDIGNWCSLDFLLPIGIYDAHKIDGQANIGIGTDKDSYDAINGQHIQFENRYVISDTSGAFGSPMTDSVRTAITDTTSHALIIIWAPADFPQDKLQQHSDGVVSRIRTICGGQVVENRIMQGSQ